MTESSMAVGIVAVVLVFLVRSGALQLGIEWVQRRLGRTKPEVVSPPPLTEAALDLPDLLAQHLAKVRAWEEEVAGQHQRHEASKQAMIDALTGTAKEKQK